jgi:hypothetical protein
MKSRLAAGTPATCLLPGLRRRSPGPQVADEFKKKYYDVLGNNPRLFMRFFKDDSVLTVTMPDAQPKSGTGPEVRIAAADECIAAVQQSHDAAREYRSCPGPVGSSNRAHDWRGAERSAGSGGPLPRGQLPSTLVCMQHTHTHTHTHTHHMYYRASSS